MEREALTQWLALTLTAALLTGVGFLVPVLDRQRVDLALKPAKIEEGKGMSPSVRLATTVLGSFRGLALDVLWARADQLQTQGEFFEAQTLAEMITTLQPRFPQVWGFQAWNMAFNISAATQAPEDRWEWINKALRLLRKRGIRYNPTHAKLYEELSIIYYEKIADDRDRHHWFYKARMAHEMGEVLGDLTGGRKIEGALEAFRRIAQAPQTLEELRAQQPGTDRLLEILAEHGAKPDADLLRMLGRFAMYQASQDASALGASRGRYVEGTNIQLVEALRKDPKSAEVLFNGLLPHLRRKVLRDEYNMEADFMMKVMERFGPLDWRHPLAHAVYWLDLGSAVAARQTAGLPADELTIFRRRQLALQELVQRGRIEYDPYTRRVDYLPDARFIVAYENAILDAFARMASERGLADMSGEKATPEDLVSTYEKMLNTAVVAGYLYGDEAQAARYYQKLRELVSKANQGALPARLENSLEDFVSAEISEVLEVNVANTRQTIDNLIRRGLVGGLAHGRQDTFVRFFKLAKRMYDRRYGEDAVQRATLAQSNIGTFQEVVSGSYIRLMEQPSLPLLVRSRIWRNTYPGLQAAVFPKLYLTFAQQSKAENLNPALAFPPPPGFENLPAAADPGKLLLPPPEEPGAAPAKPTGEGQDPKKPADPATKPGPSAIDLIPQKPSTP